MIKEQTKLMKRQRKDTSAVVRTTGSSAALDICKMAMMPLGQYQAL
jgi:hypothetical protein